MNCVNRRIVIWVCIYFRKEVVVIFITCNMWKVKYFSMNIHIIIIIIRVFCQRAGISLQTQAPTLQVLTKGRCSAANSGTKVAVVLGMNRYGSFPLLSAPHSLFSIWTDLKRSEKIPGPPAMRWGEWIWLTEPSGLHRNLPALNISSIRVFYKIKNPEISSTLRPSIDIVYFIII